MIGGADLTGALGLGPGRRGRRVRGHRPQVASPLVGTARYRVAGRCEKVGSATILHPGPGRRSHSAGLPATRGQRRPTVTVELPGPGRAGRRRRDRRLGIDLHDPALAGAKMRSNPGSTSPGSSSPTRTSPAKAAKVLDLYDRGWDGKPLSANDFVISADENASGQARCRWHPCTQSRPG
jgi:hypothetical protein